MGAAGKTQTCATSGCKALTLLDKGQESVTFTHPLEGCRGPSSAGAAAVGAAGVGPAAAVAPALLPEAPGAS